METINCIYSSEHISGNTSNIIGKTKNNFYHLLEHIGNIDFLKCMKNEHIIFFLYEFDQELDQLSIDDPVQCAPCPLSIEMNDF